MKKQIPNCLSILNLISGTIGIVLALDGYLTYGAYAIFIGACFDFLDGFIAKIFHAQSVFGKELDALADLITFGMLPASILYFLMKMYETCFYLPYTALLIVVCAALRLAKFNVGTRQAEEFIGLPTPASAILVATLPIMLKLSFYHSFVNVLTQPLVLPLLTILLAYLLVSKIPFIALKFQGFSFTSNRLRYVLIVIWILLIATMHIEGLFFSFWSYVLYAFYRTIIKEK